MFEAVIKSAFIALCGFSAIRFVADFVGSAIYDVSAIKLKRNWAKHPYSKSNLRKPIVSVIVLARNTGDELEACLKNLLQSQYKNYEIIIIDNASTDNTKQLAQDLIKNYPHRTIKLTCKRNYTSPPQALKEAFSRSISGELAIMIEPTYKLAKSALKQIVWRFAQSDISLLAMSVKILPYPSLLGVIEQLFKLAKMPACKLKDILGIEYSLDIFGTVFHKKAYLEICKANKSKGITPTRRLHLWAKSHKLAYMEESYIFKSPSSSYISFVSQMVYNQQNVFRLFFRRMPGILDFTVMVVWILQKIAAVLTLALIGYFLYLAIYFDQSDLFVLCWVLISGYILLAIYGDKYSTIKQKLRLSLFVPFFMYWFCIVVTATLLGSLAPKPYKQAFAK